MLQGRNGRTMGNKGLICDWCYADAEEGDTKCWSCGHTTFVYEPGNAKVPTEATQERKDVLSGEDD